MAFAVQFGISNKKVNSTLQPTGNLSVEVACELKERTSVENPTFVIQKVLGSGWQTWNYCKCETFGRYYFINDIAYVEGRLEVSCRCDYLASYKTDILNASPYVVRSASLHNENLTDTLFPTMATNQISKTISGSFGFSQSGSIIVTTAGKNGNAFHAQTRAQFSSLCNYLFSSTYLDALTDITKIGDVVTKQMFNTGDYVLSAVWVPFSIGGGSDSISLGYISGCGNGTSISNGKIWGKVVTVTAPHHPNHDGYAYRDFAPFSEFSLSIPYIGTVPIPCDFLRTDRTISIGMASDVNGNLQCSVFNSSGELGTFFGACGASVGFGSRNNNAGNHIATGIGSLVASGVSGNILGAGAGILGIVSGLTSASISSSGSSGCNVLNDYCTLTSSFRIQAIKVDETNHGRPLCQPTLLSSLEGYTLCENASIECGATEQGKATINNFLNGGFYIE